MDIYRFRVTQELAEREHLQTLLTTGRHAARKLLKAQILFLTDRGPDGPGRTSDEISQLTMLACSTPPEGRDRWLARLLIDRVVALENVPSASASTMQRTSYKSDRAVTGRVLVHSLLPRPVVCVGNGIHVERL